MAFVEHREDLGEVQFDGGIRQAEDAFGVFCCQRARAQDMDGPSLGIEDPDLGNAHSKVLVKANLNTRPSIFRGKDFDAKRGRLADDPGSRLGSVNNAEVWNPKARGGDLYADVRDSL